MSESNNGTFMAVAVGIVIGVGILVGMSSVISGSLSPVTVKLDAFTSEQNRMERTVVAKIDKLELAIDRLDNKVQALQMVTAQLSRPQQAEQPQRPQPQQPQEPQMDLNTVHDIAIGDSYVKGKADAPVTIVEFTDMQCPYCSRFHGPITEMLKAYPDKVKLVLKNFPLPMHPQARPAAKAALAAGLQNKYFEMVDLILANQQVLADGKYKEWAGQLGLNMDKFTKDLQDNEAAWEKRLDAEMEQGANVGVRGTPTYFLNGKQTMARTPEQWKAEIDAILKK